jgi:hypothetical protein
VPLFVDVSLEEHANGACPACGRKAEWLTCWQCLDTAWVIDCSHRTDPPALRSGRLDGSDATRIFCSECAELHVEAEEPDE